MLKSKHRFHSFPMPKLFALFIFENESDWNTLHTVKGHWVFNINNKLVFLLLWIFDEMKIISTSCQMTFHFLICFFMLNSLV